jgi:TnsA endonuclease N terminal/TnsA endonuclease C terminal
MAKRKRATTKQQTEKRLKEGRGLGTFENYKPWLRIQDVSSTGLSTRIKGWKTNRIHQLLSKLELSYFYLLEWSNEIIDIREQYPLDLTETKAIAFELELKHPTDPTTKEAIVMTTDFLITVEKPIGLREIARTIKYAQDLNEKRVLEKFEIERVYWGNRNISWSIVTEKDIDITTVENIKWLHPCREREYLPSGLSEKQAQKAFSKMSQMFKAESISIYNVTQFCDFEFQFESGISLKLFRYFLANRLWTIDISKSLNPRINFHLQNQNLKGEQI